MVGWFVVGFLFGDFCWFSWFLLGFLSFRGFLCANRVQVFHKVGFDSLLVTAWI